MIKQSNTEEIYHRTGLIIRDERRSRDLTQIELAGEIGISQSALSKIENQSMIPTLIPWLKFCSVFGLPANLPLDEKLYKTWKKDKERKTPRKKQKASSLKN